MYNADLTFFLFLRLCSEFSVNARFHDKTVHILRSSEPEAEAEPPPMAANSAEPFPIHHRQLSIDLSPVTKRIRPLLRNIVSSQIKRLQQSLTVRKYIP